MNKLINSRFEVHIADHEARQSLHNRVPTLASVEQRLVELDEKVTSAIVSLLGKPVSQLTFRQRIALAYILDAMPQ
ncbi:MAG: hypothetical protein ACOYBW_08880 [Fluviibacter phosphoraccumulans]